VDCAQAAKDVHGRPPHEGITTSLGAQLGVGSFTSSETPQQSDLWYNATGKVLSHSSFNDSEWASLIQACKGIIAFDAVLCAGELHRYDMGPVNLSPRIACISLGGCQQCATCPEGPSKPGGSPESALPLLFPLPLHSSSVKAARRPDTKELAHPMMIARCWACLKDRWCERCNVWWCEACYTVPPSKYPLPLADPPIERNISSIKVHNHLCVSTCLMDELLNGVGEGGMWG